MAYLITGTDASGGAIREAYERHSAAEVWLRTYLGLKSDAAVLKAERDTVFDLGDGRRLTVSYEALTASEIRDIQGI